MNPELQYIIELIRRSPRDYKFQTISHANTVLVKCPDGTTILIQKRKDKEN